MDPDKAPGSSLGLDVTMDQGVITAFLGQNGPMGAYHLNTDMVTGGGHSALGGTAGTEINTDHSSCIRALKPDMAVGSSPGPDISMALGGRQTSPMSSMPSSCSLPSTVHIFLSPQHMNISASLSFSHFFTIYSHSIMVPSLLNWWQWVACV